MVTISNANSLSGSSSGNNAAQNARPSNSTNNAASSANGGSGDGVGNTSSGPATGSNGGGNSSSSSSNNSANKTDSSAVISSLGFGTSLPLSTLLTGLMQVASIPLHNYQHQQDGVKTELSAYAQLKSSLTTFQSSLGNLTLAANFKSLNANSSDKSVLNADVFTGAQPGNYAVDVKQLAQAQTLVSGGQASVSSAVGSGKPTVLSFNFGTIGSTADDKTKSATGGEPDSDGHYGDGTTFTPSAGTNKTVKINSGNNTMGGIRDAINSAGMGVTASIVNDGSATPYKLVLTNTATGAAQAMQITVDGDPAVSDLL
jgi:flagellar hook-associated protein 2